MNNTLGFAEVLDKGLVGTWPTATLAKNKRNKANLHITIAAGVFSYRLLDIRIGID